MNGSPDPSNQSMQHWPSLETIHIIETHIEGKFGKKKSVFESNQPSTSTSGLTATT